MSGQIFGSVLFTGGGGGGVGGCGGGGVGGCGGGANSTSINQQLAQQMRAAAEMPFPRVVNEASFLATSASDDVKLLLIEGENE